MLVVVIWDGLMGYCIYFCPQYKQHQLYSACNVHHIEAVNNSDLTFIMASIGQHVLPVFLSLLSTHFPYCVPL